MAQSVPYSSLPYAAGADPPMAIGLRRKRIIALPTDA